MKISFLLIFSLFAFVGKSQVIVEFTDKFPSPSPYTIVMRSLESTPVIVKIYKEVDGYWEIQEKFELNKNWPRREYYTGGNYQGTFAYGIGNGKPKKLETVEEKLQKKKEEETRKWKVE